MMILLGKYLFFCMIILRLSFLLWVIVLVVCLLCCMLLCCIIWGKLKWLVRLVLCIYLVSCELEILILLFMYLRGWWGGIFELCIVMMWCLEFFLIMSFLYLSILVIVIILIVFMMDLCFRRCWIWIFLVWCGCLLCIWMLCGRWCRGWCWLLFSMVRGLGRIVWGWWCVWWVCCCLVLLCIIFVIMWMLCVWDCCFLSSV